MTVLRLERNAYVESGVVRRGDSARSVLLEGLSVDVSAVFDAN
jgi:hypothetical protein